MANTSISWCDCVWNPVVGCSRVSDGCQRCYAEGMAHRGMSPQHRGLTVMGANGRTRWTGEVRTLPERLAVPLHWRKPKRIFVNSMSDLFHDNVPFEFIAAVFGVMAACPQHRFMVLTKRPERMQEWFKWVDPDPAAMGGRLLKIAAGQPWPLHNVYLGVSVENQDALHRIEKLRDTPAAVRFVSFEPLLGPIQTRAMHRMHLNWAIFGCESGRNRRPMQIEWLESLVEQYGDYCALFVKQLEINGKVTDDPSNFPEHLRIQEFP